MSDLKGILVGKRIIDLIERDSGDYLVLDNGMAIRIEEVSTIMDPEVIPHDKLLEQYLVEEGALIEVPVHERHQRGKNWLAVIKADPASPGGLGRAFMPRGKGKYFYLIAGLKKGDPVEFGADIVNSSGRKNPCRWYGVVVDVQQNALVLEHHETASKALSAAKAFSETEKAKGNT